MTSFVDRGYSHPAYRAYCWYRETAYNRVNRYTRLKSNTSVDKVSCVWRNWVFDPLRANQWTTERRVQVWMLYLDHNCKVWFPLPKSYIEGFYDRNPTDPFLLQRPPHDVQLLLLNPKLVRVLREESSQDLDRRLRELDRAEREIRERLVENLLQVQIIETVRSAKRIPCIERLIEKLWIQSIRFFSIFFDIVSSLFLSDYFLPFSYGWCPNLLAKLDGLCLFSSLFIFFVYFLPCAYQFIFFLVLISLFSSLFLSVSMFFWFRLSTTCVVCFLCSLAQMYSRSVVFALDMVGHWCFHCLGCNATTKEDDEFFCLGCNAAYHASCWPKP